ncbi:universal stress protein [Phycicoccus sp. 3266]|jgi:nucleotide-binding universal stress UspA family protein|uniref:universal stress protein n=1 Tax=Phycicoccus sp. 3266 TaxID=2817751 RepID=UPI0028580853|nr:universal stress protein [Phycicoccus sp. 3266]MDR6864827.1 nucleotide-binding universal stress UspA family protein [Phycicoccus sp. 3266]
MSTTPTTSHPIVVGVDESAQSRLALDWAIDEARRRDLPLELVHARPMPLRGPAVETAFTRPGVDGVLEDAVARVHSLAPHASVATSGAHGAAAPMLVDASRDATMLVVGARGRGALRSAMLGSTSLDVAAHAHSPVVVVRELSQALPDRPGVVVGIDGSPISEGALGEAFRQADARGLPLTVVHAWFLDYAGTGLAVLATDAQVTELAQEERSVADDAVARWSARYPGVTVREHVLNAHPVQALVDHSKGAELLVVGTRGRGGFGGLVLGSVSQGVLHHAHCPVMVVRSQPETVPSQAPAVSAAGTQAVTP